MVEFYEYNSGLRFIGGVFTLLLGVTIVYGKQELKRHFERKRLEQKRESEPTTFVRTLS